jgi:hypothetical protein
MRSLGTSSACAGGEVEPTYKTTHPRMTSNKLIREALKNEET